MTSKKQKSKIKKSGNPAKRSQRTTSASRWNDTITHEVALPSGNVCLVKRPGLPELLAANIFTDDTIDLITRGIANAQLRMEGKPVLEEESDDEIINGVINSPDKIAKMFEMFDKTLVYAVVEPRVAYHKDDDGKLIPMKDRDPDVVYTDRVLEEDKIFIFQYVSGGSSDLSRFRETIGDALADLSDGQGVQAAPEHNPEGEGRL